MYKTNIKLWGEEIDLIIVDEEAKAICVAELRWMLPAGDHRESSHRIEACEKKIGQLKRRVNVIQTNLLAILRQFKIENIVNKEWSIQGVVVTEGFSGTMAGFTADVPIVPSSVFAVGVKLCSNVRKLNKWLSSKHWLPQEGLHFKLETEDISFGSRKIYANAFSLEKGSAYYFSDYLAETIQAVNNV